MGSIYCSTNRLKKGQKRLLILYLFFIFYSIFFFLLDISFYRRFSLSEMTAKSLSIKIKALIAPTGT